MRLTDPRMLTAIVLAMMFTGVFAFAVYTASLDSSVFQAPTIKADAFYVGGQTLAQYLAVTTPRAPTSYIMWVDGATYYTQNGQTGAITSNANFSTLTATIIANNVSIFIKNDTYAVSTKIDISSKSNVEIFSDGALLQKTGNIQGIYIDTSDNIRVNGLRFERMDAAGQTFDMVVVRGSTDVWITNNVFDACYEAVVVRTNAAHAKSERVHINGNEFFDFGYSAINFYNGCDSCEAVGNVIHDGVSANGTHLYGIATNTIAQTDTTNKLVENLRIADNTIYNFDHHNAIDFHGGNSVSITGNIIFNMNDATAGTAIYAHRPTEAGQTYTSTQNWVIANNVIGLCTHGIVVENDEDTASAAVEGVTVSGNTLTDVKRRGILIQVADNAFSSMIGVNVVGNTVNGCYGDYANGRGISVQAGVLTGSATVLNVSNNIVVGTNGAGGANKWETGIYASYWVTPYIHDNYISDCDDAVEESNCTTEIIIRNVGDDL